MRSAGRGALTRRQISRVKPSHWSLNVLPGAQADTISAYHGVALSLLPTLCLSILLIFSILQEPGVYFSNIVKLSLKLELDVFRAVPSSIT